MLKDQRGSLPWLGDNSRELVFIGIIINKRTCEPQKVVHIVHLHRKILSKTIKNVNTSTASEVDRGAVTRWPALLLAWLLSSGVGRARPEPATPL